MKGEDADMNKHFYLKVLGWLTLLLGIVIYLLSKNNTFCIRIVSFGCYIVAAVLFYFAKDKR